MKKEEKYEKHNLKRVLAIDDDEEYNFLTELMFEDSGIDCELIFFTSAEESMNYLENNRDSFPNLILLDINMPIMNGWDFLEEYMERGYDQLYNTWIIVLSSSVYNEDKQKAMTYPSVIEYIEKPLSGEAIDRLVAEYYMVEA